MRASIHYKVIGGIYRNWGPLIQSWFFSRGKRFSPCYIVSFVSSIFTRAMAVFYLEEEGIWSRYFIKFVSSGYVVCLLFVIEIRLANSIWIFLFYDCLPINHILFGRGENYFIEWLSLAGISYKNPHSACFPQSWELPCLFLVLGDCNQN